MPIPSISTFASSNAQLRGIQGLRLSAADEAAYKAALAAEYKKEIAELGLRQNSPYLRDQLQRELDALSTLTSAELASFQVRG